MDLRWHEADSEARFSAYIERLSACLGHADRVAPFRSYCTGLLLPGARKSVEPMAARLRPDRTSAEHQSLLHFVGQSAWDDKVLLASVRRAVLPAMTAERAIEAWIVDDTGFPKKGRHSVGVGHQYCGQRGKQENCQVAVSLCVATAQASLPVAWRLYLPRAWAEDAARRRKARVPASVAFQSKPEIAVEQIAAARAEGIEPGVVLADAGYGHSGPFRAGLAALELDFLVGVQGDATVWPEGQAPQARRKPGRPPKGSGRTAPPQQVSALAMELPGAVWRSVGWREGSAATLSSRFAALRVRPVERRGDPPCPEHWLLVEWPEGEDEPTRYWLSNLPADTAIERLVYLAKLRWLIERDYQELKQELGLGHYEGRGWPGFHHHAALCIAAYGFLVAEKAAFPPSDETARLVQAPELPTGHRPRGSPDPNREARRVLDRHARATDRSGPDPKTAKMPMLRTNRRIEKLTKPELMTQ